MCHLAVHITEERTFPELKFVAFTAVFVVPCCSEVPQLAAGRPTAVGPGYPPLLTRLLRETIYFAA